MRVGRVVIHSTQRWPYSANLMMMGAIGEAFPDGEEIILKHDPELEDAQWVGLGQVKSGLERSTGTPDVEAEGAVEACSSWRGERGMQGLMLVVILLVRRSSYDSCLRLLSRIKCFLRWSMAFIWPSSRSYLALHNSTSRNIIEHILHLENKDTIYLPQPIRSPS